MQVDILKWAAPFALPLAFVAFNLWFGREMNSEVARNGLFDAPDDRQIRWHIRHLRQDVALACYLLMAIVGLLAYIAFWK